MSFAATSEYLNQPSRSRVAALRQKHFDALRWARFYREKAVTGSGYTLKGDATPFSNNVTRQLRILDRETAIKEQIAAASIRRAIASEKAYRASLPKLTTDGRPNPYAIGEAA